MEIVTPFSNLVTNREHECGYQKDDVPILLDLLKNSLINRGTNIDRNIYNT